MSSVVGDNGELHRIDRLRMFLVIPVHLDQTGGTLRRSGRSRGISHDVPDIAAVFPMHAYAVPASDVADDLIARHRVTAARQVHKAVLDARYDHARIVMGTVRSTLAGVVLLLGTGHQRRPGRDTLLIENVPCQ